MVNIIAFEGVVTNGPWCGGASALDSGKENEGARFQAIPFLVPLCTLPLYFSVVGMSLEWALQKVNEIMDCLGISCKGFEDQFMALLIAIERGHAHCLFF